MRIIFLDIDGVLNSTSTKDRFNGWIGVDYRYLDTLKQLVDISNKQEETKIVLSSSWRVNENNNKETLSDDIDCYNYIAERLKSVGLEIYDSTPYINNGASRGKEISTWLSMNSNITSWVVLDDEMFKDFKSEGITKHLVQTSFYNNGGLQSKHIGKALEILNKTTNKQEET